ncbi:Os04g0563500 [Oryza sativa Japonica Group]|uniref:Os04g0563500 protein n=1 Tax=Oryza sativa subsp. japonica TaxID=39947 RepID=C7J1V5_ORYSJ|nr:Os04g0563500 [Oryza sativa Japonica Group]|eukprot:NP_001174042.1 Os04g0563500 [Oryza sativa Japonica Group]
MATWFYQKAVLSRSPSEHADHAVMIIHRDMDWVSFVRPGGSNWQVASTLDVNGKDRYADCVYHNGGILHCDSSGDSGEMDLEGPNGPTKEVIVSKMQYLPGLLTRHLVSTPWGYLLQVRAISRGQVKNGTRLQVREVHPDGSKKAHSAQASSKAAASERSSATPLVRAASPAPAISAPSPTKPASAPVKPACAKPMEEGLGAGDPLLRPQGGHGVLSWTPGMSAIEQRLRGRSLVASVLSGRKEVSPATMVAALSGLCGVPPGDVCVELAVEGLPAHAMEIEAVKQLLNKIDCQFIELFDPVDACMLEVLAWSADPSKIPKEFILDIPEPMQEWWMPPATDDPDMFELLVSQSPPAPPTEKKCLTFDLLLHLREVVDPVRQLPDSPSYDPFLDDREAPRRRTYNAFLGRIDGSGPGQLLGGGHGFAGSSAGTAGGLQRQLLLEVGVQHAEPAPVVPLVLPTSAQQAPPLVLPAPVQHSVPSVDGLAAAQPLAASDIAQDVPSQAAAVAAVLGSPDVLLGSEDISPPLASLSVGQVAPPSPVGGRTPDVGQAVAAAVLGPSDFLQGPQFSPPSLSEGVGPAPGCSAPISQAATAQVLPSAGNQASTSAMGATSVHTSPGEAVITMQLVGVGPGSLTSPASAPARLGVTPPVSELRQKGLARQLSFDAPAQDLPCSAALMSPQPPQATAPVDEDERANTGFNSPGARELAPLCEGASQGILGLGPWPEVHISSPALVYCRRHLRPTTGRKWPTRRAASGSPPLATQAVASPVQGALQDASRPVPDLLAGEIVTSLGDLMVPLPGAILGKFPPPTPVRRSRRMEPYTQTPRRSERLAAMNGGRHQHSASKAQRVLMKKLGVVDDENKVEETDILKYLELFKTPLVPSHIQALAALCCVKVSASQGVERWSVHFLARRSFCCELPAQGNLVTHAECDQLGRGAVWTLTNVYGPQAPEQKLAVAHEVILQLDRAMDSRQLSPEERSLRAILKGRCLALASLERIRLRQRARLRYLKHSGTASQFFHLKINARRRKKTIPMIQHGGVWGVTQEDKLDMAHDYFCSIMGSPSPPSAALDLGRLGLPSLDLLELEVEITEDEAKKHLHLLNTASIILLPKKDDPTQLADYRPISLIHSFIKLFTKVLATRLAARMNELVGPAQSAFIKSRRIQENFLYVQGVVRKIHRAKCPAVLLKLDIAKAFDSVSWEFLIELLRHLGFGSKWRDCIAVLLGSSSTTVCINGQDTHRIRLARGLRQGDPLSPLLFDLVMETFAALCNTAVCRGALSPLTGGVLPLRTSLYADDAIIFFHPSSMDAASIRCLLSMMGAATGLVSNYSKSSITPIHCSQEQIDEVADVLGCPVRQLPIKYLGLPLSVRKPVKADIQPLMDRLGKNLAGWKPKLLGPDACLAIIKHMLMTLPLYFMSVLELPSWAIKEIERKCRGFLWKGDENAAGTCSLVA